MGWSYSGDPGSSTRDAVRFLIGDTDANDQQLSDEEVEYLIDTHTANIYAAAKAGVRTLIAKYSRMVSKAVGDLRIDYSDRVKNYRQLLGEIDAIAAGAGVSLIPVPYAGGISESDKQTDETDTDRVKPSFAIGMHDFDGTADNEATG